MRLWKSAVERAGAVDGVLGVGGAARLLDASCVSSRNTELLNGESCLHAAFNGQRAAAVRIDHRRSRGAAWAGARNAMFRSSRRPIRGSSYGRSVVARTADRVARVDGTNGTTDDAPVGEN